MRDTSVTTSDESEAMREVGRLPRADASTKLALDRTLVAHERTVLSWVRTSTSLITFGFSIQQFFRIARAGRPDATSLIGPYGFGTLMMIIGLFALVLGVVEHRSALNELRQQYPVTLGYQPFPRLRARAFAGLIACLGLLGLVSMVLRQ